MSAVGRHLKSETIILSVISNYLQDQGLDTIAEGLDTLKNMAHDMNEVGPRVCFLF